MAVRMVMAGMAAGMIVIVTVWHSGALAVAGLA